MPAQAEACGSLICVFGLAGVSSKAQAGHKAHKLDRKPQGTRSPLEKGALPSAVAGKLVKLRKGGSRQAQPLAFSSRRPRGIACSLR